MEILADNVNEAYERGLSWLAVAGIEEGSRNGAVIVAPEPVMTTYLYPFQRVLFSPLRDANPFFHLMESLWMLAGRNDVAFPAMFAANMRSFSDDGRTLHGAYGHRWREHFGGDQLHVIIDELKKNPESRRCVLQMWDIVLAGDLGKATNGGKDVPCNTHAYLDARGGELNITVCCRSNDIVWGAYGANAVHFSVLQEYLAAAIGCPVGKYRQFSNNYHLYPANLRNPENLPVRDLLKQLASDASSTNYYDFFSGHKDEDIVESLPLVRTSAKQWSLDLDFFMGVGWKVYDYADPFFSKTAVTMRRAWELRKEKAPKDEVLGVLKTIEAQDWRKACVDWVERRG